MRITHESMYRTILSDVLRMQYDQFRTSQEIATNHRVNAPSDSDYAVTILRSRHSLTEVDQYQVNLEAATSWMKASESSMQSMVERLARAKALAEQLSTGTYQPLQQQAAASEVDNLIDQIISLANTALNGSYIFGGTRNNVPAITDLLMAPDPAVLAPDSPTGHNTEASIYTAGGNSYLRLGRQTGGAANTIAISAANSLGETGALGLTFDAANFSHTQTAADNPLQTDIYTSDQALAGPGSLVSDMIGETLSWNAAGAPQTYVTHAVVTFSGAVAAGQVRVDASVYAVAGVDALASASNLVQQINGDPANQAFAWMEQSGTSYEVHIASRTPGVGTYAVTQTAADPNMSVDGTITLQEATAQMNSGLTATGAMHISAVPLDASTVTVGGATATWAAIRAGVIPPAAATPANYAAALVSWINANNQDVTASFSQDAGVASVQIMAREAGAAGNAIALNSTDVSVTASAAFLLGGLDGADTSGKLMGTGTSTLRLATTVRGEVLDVDAGTGAVTMRLSWYDDSGKHQTLDTVIPEGEGSAVTISQLGGIQLYRDDKLFAVGAVFELDLIHYQGNDEEINVNFSNGARMRYNWTARQVLGDALGVNLDGSVASALRQAGSTGNLELSGIYRGLMPRDLTFDVIDAGQVPGDDVTLRVSWTDDEGLPHTKELTVSGAGADSMVALPVFGNTPRINLDGDQAALTSGAGTGQISITGAYKGFYSRDFTFTVTDGGQLPGDPVGLTATWTDDNGQTHSEALTVSTSGSAGYVELPGSEGVRIYLDTGTFVAGDVHTYNLRLNPPHAGEAIYFQLDNGVFVAGDSFHQRIDKTPLHVLDTLKEWKYQMESGDQEAAQTQSQRTLVTLTKALNTILDHIADAGTRQNRVKVRENVLEDHITYHSKNLEELQDVDLTQAFMDLRAQQTAYGASLKVIAVMSDMNLLSYL